MSISNDEVQSLVYAWTAIWSSASVITNLLTLVGYILSSLGFYTIAKRRGIRNPWLAWIPVANLWILGSLSDQYRYVVRGQIKSKRKLMLVLELVIIGLVVAVVAAGVVSLVMGVQMFLDHQAAAYASRSQSLATALMVMVGAALPLLAVTIAQIVVQYMALYDVYQSLDPSNSALFLVLSILFGIVQPFLIFFNRNKDMGMPPRREDATPGRLPGYDSGPNREYV